MNCHFFVLKSCKIISWWENYISFFRDNSSSQKRQKNTLKADHQNKKNNFVRPNHIWFLIVPILFFYFTLSIFYLFFSRMYSKREGLSIMIYQKKIFHGKFLRISHKLSNRLFVDYWLIFNHTWAKIKVCACENIIAFPITHKCFLVWDSWNALNLKQNYCVINA